MYDVKRGIIVSCQPRKGSALEDVTFQFAKEVIDGGAAALRIEGIGNIIKVVSESRVPVIGIIKVSVPGKTLITPEYRCAELIIDVGQAAYVGTGAIPYAEVDEIKQMVKAGFNVIADIATIEQALLAQNIGCCAVTTALAGYTDAYKAKEFEYPDLILVELCAKLLSIPVIAEGRYNTQEKVAAAIDAGAHSVCIGAAITLPDYLTRYYKMAIDERLSHGKA